MGWVGAISFSILWNLLNLYGKLPIMGANPTMDVIVKGIISGFLVIVIKELSPI